MRFDEGTAWRLVAALDDLAAALQAIVVGEGDRSAAVRRDWEGFSRTWFDHQHHDLLTSLRTAVATCRGDAEEVRRSIARASAIQEAHNAEAQATAAAAQAEADRLAELASS